MTFFDKLLEDLKRDEGFNHKSFWDNKQWTWGYGTCAPGPDCFIDLEQAEEELKKHALLSISNAVKALGKPYWETIGEARQRALCNMAFNLGYSGLLGFRKMLQALREQRWKDARNEALDSKWLWDVKKRALRISLTLELGVDHGIFH